MAPCLLAPLSLLFPWFTLHVGSVLPAGPSYFVPWLLYSEVGNLVNHDALAGLYMRLGAAFVPALFAALWLRGARQGTLLAVLLLGLSAWVPGVVEHDDSLIAFWMGGPQRMAYLAGPLLRAVPIAVMAWLAIACLVAVGRQIVKLGEQLLHERLAVPGIAGADALINGGAQLIHRPALFGDLWRGFRCGGAHGRSLLRWPGGRQRCGGRWARS